MKGVLLVSIGFSPNIGGIETHFDDLVKGLRKRKFRVTVLTYQPLTQNITAKYIERKNKEVTIIRLPIIRGFFYKFISSPIHEFLYLTPILFLALPFLILVKGNQFQVIHSHGLIAGLVSVFWGKVFRRRVITTTHSIYNFPKSGFYRSLAKLIFYNSDRVLTLSHQSAKEVISLGVDPKKVNNFTYWIDLKNFHKVKDAKEKLGLGRDFIVLFVGRLIKEKGVIPLLSAAKKTDKKFLFVGTGPLEETIQKFSKKYKNIILLGCISQHELPLYYSAADVLIVPSVHEEGFGRVIIEALACGLPVIGSNRGAIPEAIDESVGRLIKVSSGNILNMINYLSRNRALCERLSKKAREFTERRYSEKNIETIIKAYSKEA